MATDPDNIHTIQALCPLDGRYAKQVDSLRPIFSEYGLIKYRVWVEIQWFRALAQHPQIPELPSLNSDTQAFLDQLFDNFDERAALQIKSIEKTTQHDIKAIEYFLKEQFQKHKALSGSLEFIHFGCTSEDINNLAYGLMLKKARDTVILPQMKTLLQTIETFSQSLKDCPMLSHTHGQPASPSTLGKEFANFYMRLHSQTEQFARIPIKGKINGAVGNFNAHSVAYPEVDWIGVSQQFVQDLGLDWNPLTTQIEPHDAMAEYFHVLSRFNTILIDFARDIWGYIALGYFKQSVAKGQVGSSTMPHKINPIQFENAEGNLGIANALYHHLANKLPISRWQRDLTDSTVLRNIGIALGYTLTAYQAICKGLDLLEANRQRIEADLNQHWEILAEAIQTVMRRYNQPTPYEKLKALTQGHVVTKEQLQAFIQALNLPDPVKAALMQLTPSQYIGEAVKLSALI